MDVERVLLLFSPDHPCWDRETVSLTGEDPSALTELAGTGDVAPLGGGFVLTSRGVQTRERISRELCVPAAPADEVLADEVRAGTALEVNRMVQYLDRAFMTDWGVKEITVREEFPVVPCLPDDRYFALQDGRVRALWPGEPLVRSFMEAFPHCDFSARQRPAPGQEALDRWAEENHAPQGTLTVDFVLRHRHDFNHYKDYAPLPTDVFRFRNASLLMARKVNGPCEDLLPFIGKVHLFFMAQRRVYAPGWFDMDCEDQETWKLLTLVTDTEAQLGSLTATLRAWGRDLIEPARPMFILGTSIERMRHQKAPQRTFYDWFQEETVRILRPDAPDGA